MSRILHLVSMSQIDRGSKGVREYRQEEPPWTILAAPVTWRRVLRTYSSFGSHEPEISWIKVGVCFSSGYVHFQSVETLS